MSNPATPFGLIAEREYESAKDCHQPKLGEWLAALPTLSDEEFFWKAASAIHGSALAEGFRGNWEHEHCRATAALAEARRRHRAAGHDEDCTGDTIWSRAFAQVWREQGHSADAYPPRRCDCGSP